MQQPWIYIQTEPGLFTVGREDSNGTWIPDSDWDSKKEAGDHIHYLNGGNSGRVSLQMAALMIAQGYISAGAYKDDEQEGEGICRCAVSMAKIILEEANK